jgi:hypothetical protein
MWHILWSNYLKEMGNNIKIGGCKSGSGWVWNQTHLTLQSGELLLAQRTVKLFRNDRNHRVHTLDDILIVGTCTVWIKQKLSTAPYLRDNPIPFIGPAVALVLTRIASITSVLQSIFIWQLFQISVIPTEHFTAVSWDSTAKVKDCLQN